MKNILVCVALGLQGIALVGLMGWHENRVAWGVFFLLVLILLLALVFCHSSAPASYFETYCKIVSARYGLAAMQRMRSDVEALLGNGSEDCVGRINEILSGSAKCAKGLVVGRVQSGKTQHFIGVITKAIDDKWDAIVVLTSDNSALADQTRNRLREDLAASGLLEEQYNFVEDFCNADSFSTLGDGCVSIGVALKETNHLGEYADGKGVLGWLHENREVLAQKRILIVDDEADSYSQNSNADNAKYWDYADVMDCAADIRKGVAGAEDVHHIEVAQWVEDMARLGLDVEQDRLDVFESLCGELEGDGRQFGSEEFVQTILGLDSKYLKILRVGNNRFVENFFTRRIDVGVKPCGETNTLFDAFYLILKYVCQIKPERSCINKKICELVGLNEHCEKLAYIGYTATPYANILNERFESGNPLEPDFMQSMELSPEYFGLDKIFGFESDGCLPMIIDVDSSSREEAVAWTFCCAALRVANRKKKASSDIKDAISERWTTMLVNLSSRISDHHAEQKKLETILADKLENRDSFIRECLCAFDKFAPRFTAERYHALFHDGAGNPVDLNREVVESGLNALLMGCPGRRVCNVIIINGESANKDNYKWYSQDPEYLRSHAAKRIDGDCIWIVVGGNKLSRGLTFDGLVASYFIRNNGTGNVDTLTQMGRWFGYRRGYELMPRVWMQSNMIEWYRDIGNLERDWHAKAKELFDSRGDVSNLCFIDIGRRFTGRDAVAVRDAGDNPVVIHEYCADDGVRGALLKSTVEFVRGLGNTMVRPESEYSDTCHRLPFWKSVNGKCVADYLNGVSKAVSDFERSRMKRFLVEIGEEPFDVALEDPANKRRVVQIAGRNVHVHGTSDVQYISNGIVASEKFYGQYDALKAGITSRILRTVEGETGAKANTPQAFEKMFAYAKKDGVVVNPILRIGFLEMPGRRSSDGVIVAVSVYWPLHARKAVVAASVDAKNAKAVRGHRPTDRKGLPQEHADDDPRVEQYSLELLKKREEPGNDRRCFWLVSKLTSGWPRQMKQLFTDCPDKFGWGKFRRGQANTAYFSLLWAKTSEEAKEKAIDQILEDVRAYLKLMSEKKGVVRKEDSQQLFVDSHLHLKDLYADMIKTQDVFPTSMNDEGMMNRLRRHGIFAERRDSKPIRFGAII